MSLEVDGCSGPVNFVYQVIFHKQFPLEFCCDEHDVAYVEGGTWKDKLLADKRFFYCLWDNKTYVKAIIFWLAVAIFGWYYWNQCAKERKIIENYLSEK